MCKELRLSDSDYGAIEDWEREISEEYEEIEYLEGFFEVDSSEMEEYID